MAEFWQDVQKRALATQVAWSEHFSTLQIGAFTAADFATLIGELEPAAGLRDARIHDYDQATQTRDFSDLRLRLLGKRVPALIEGMVDSESGLLDDLDKVYAIRPESFASAISRGHALVPIWKSVNQWQTGQTPPRPVVVAGTATVSTLESELVGTPTLLAGVATAEEQVTRQRSTLRALAMKVDRISKRAYKSMRATPDLSPEATAALDDIPTTTTSDLPDTLGIRTITQGGVSGRQILVRYEPHVHEEGETLKIEWMIVGVDVGFDSHATVDPSGNALGPFVVGQEVKVRTTVTNPAGTRTGSVRTLTILEPPE
jgi:hypothetical protein